jgi:hypothetical protein
MKAMTGRIKRIEREINKKVSSKPNKLKFTTKDVDAIKTLCLNFKKYFRPNTKFIDEDAKVNVPGCYDDSIDDDLKMFGYIWFKNLAIVYASCEIKNMWDEVEKIPELAPLMKYKTR